MATRKSEWLASIKPILDRDEAKRDAKELARELGSLLEIDIDASPENLKKLTDEFNNQLSQMGKQPIVFSEKTLQGIVSQFANAVAEGFSKGADVGLKETFKLQLANLKKQKEVLLKEQDDINRRLSNRSRIDKAGNFSIERAHGLPIEEDAVKQAEKMLDKMYEYADRISELQVEQGKESAEYISTVLDAQEAYNEFLRLRKSLKQTRPSLPKDIEAAYSLFNREERVKYYGNGGLIQGFGDDEYGGGIIADAFEELSDIVVDADDQLSDIQNKLKEIDVQIEKIVAQAKAVGAADDTILGDSKDGLKTLKEIEAAYDRIAKKNKKTGGKAIDGVSAAVDYVPGSESLTTLRNRYNTSLSSNEDWEVQYQWLVKFVKEYENYSAQIEAETDSIKRKNMKARQKQYTALYEELKPMAENAETMLRSIIDVSGGKQPTGVKDGNKQGGTGVTTEDVANAEQIAVLERQAREEAVAKAKAEAEAAEAAKQKRIEEEKAAKAAEKKRIADEAAAEAQRKAAEEAERERIAKEASVVVDKTRTYTGYRAIEPPESSGKTKHDALADWGAEYFSTDKNVAASYGENFFKEGNIVIGEITPKNPLVINANGLRWDEFDKMPDLKELFPGLLDIMKQPGYIGDDGQKYINEQAKLAGYDAVILENVQDALDGDIKEYGLSTTIAVLDDKIVSLTGSMAQLEAGTNRFADVISAEIPSYYVGDKHRSDTNIIATADSSKTHSRKDELTQQLDDGYDSDAYYDQDNLEAIQRERQQILQTLEQEGLMTEDIRATQAKITDEIKHRIDVMQARNNAELTLNKLDDMGGESIEDPDELRKVIADRQAMISGISDLAFEDGDPYQLAGDVEKAKQYNSQLEKRVLLLEDVKRGIIGIDDVDDLMAETGGLETKLDRLGAVSADWGSKVKDSEVDEDDDTLESLKQFEETYDRIVLKLANGKNVEILPNAKGLRALYKYYDGIDSSAYGESEIDDVIFERIQKEAVAAEQAIDSLNDSIEETKNIMQGSGSGTGTGDASSAELEAAVTKTEALQDEVEQKNKELADKDAEIARVQAENETKLKTEADEKARLQEDLNITNQQLTDVKHENELYDTALAKANEESNIKDGIIRELREQLANVKTGTGEEQASVSSEELKNILSSIVYNVKIAHDDNDKQANKIAIDEGVLESTLKRVFTNVLNPQTEQNDSEPKNESWALEKTLLNVKEVLGQIQVNTAKPDSIEVAPAKTDVGNVLATENTLVAIKTAVESINTKVVKGTKTKTSENGSGKKSGTGKKNAESYAGSQYFPEKLKTQTMQLAKFRAQLMTTGKLTDDVDVQIYELLDGLKQVQNGPDFSAWSQKFQQLKTSVGITDIFDKAEGKDIIASYKQLVEFQKERNKLELQYEKAQDGSALKQFYAEQLAQMDSVIARQEEMLENEEYEAKLSKIKSEQARKLGAEKAKQADKEAKAVKKEMQKQAMLGKAGNAVGRAQGVYIEAEGLNPKKLPKSFTQKGGVLDSYYSAFEKLRQKQVELSKLDVISDEQKKDLRDQINNVNQMTSEIGELVSQYQRLSGDNVLELGVNTLDPNAGLKEYEAELKRLASASVNGKIQIKSFDNETKTLTYTVKNAKREVTTYTATLRGLDNQFVAVAGSTKRSESFLEATKRKMVEISSYMSGMAMLSRATQELRRGIQYVREIDLALTELKKVTDETEESYDKFLKTAAKTGARLGTTISAVTDATATFAKLGYSMEQATEMAEAAIVYKNVGDNIESTGDAADSIISTMKGFRLEASESMAIVDRFNEVGNRFAITSQGIGEALRLSASALSEGGNSLDESIAMITAANEVVNDPSSVGTALKTLTLRLRGAKTELEDAGLDIENMATTTSQLQSKLLALTGGQVDIMADANTFKSSTQILREMADAWEDMTDIQRASALELMGGKRQANVLSALIQNFDTVEEAIEASAGSAGSALRENEVFLDSFEGRLQQLTAAAQSKWSEALDTDTIKDAIQLFTKLIETLNFEDSALVDVVGLLTKALSWLMDLLGNGNSLYTLIAFFGAKTIQKHGWLDFFIGIKKTSEETIESLTEDIKGLDAEIKSLTEKANKQSGRAQKSTLQQIDVKKQLKTNKQEQLNTMKLSEKEQREVAETFDVSKMQKKIGGKKGAITRRTNELTRQGMTPEQIQSDPKIQQWNKDIKEGQQALEEYNAKIQQTDNSLKQTNATTTRASSTTSANTGTQNTNANANAANQGARQANAATTDAQTGEIVEQNSALDQNTSKLDKNTKSLGKGTGKLKEFGKQMMQTMAYMALIQGAMQIIDGIAEGVSWLWNQGFPKKKTFEELHDEFEELSSDLSEEKSKLKGLEGELENVESQIEEIQALGTLSFTNQEELENLQKQSAELERQIEMQKTLTKNKQRGANAAALGAAKAYLQQSTETDDTLEEAAEKSKETGEKWGSVVDGLLMVGGAITMIATGWTGVGAAVGGGLMAAGMAGVGKGVGGAIGESVGESEYQKQQTNQQAIDSYSTKRADYQKRLDEAYTKGDADAYGKILEEYEKFETMMADNIGGLLEYISTVDYNTLSEDQKKQYEAYNRMVNQYSLDNGGSITDAVDSILGYDRYEKTGYEFDQIQEKFKDGDISSEEAAQQMRSLIDASPSLQAEFDALDIKIEDVIASYIQLGKAAQESVSLMSSLDKISAVTNAFDDLGSAVKEFKEDGRASAGTLESLNKTFGNVDGFEELYKVLATGEGDLEASVTNVANAYVGQAQILSDMTDEELAIMVSRLQSIGVLNAEEVLMARQKGQAQLDALGLAYSIDLSNYGTAEQAKLAIAQAAGLNIASIADDQVESLAKKYGVDLENYASTEEAKIAIAQARAKAEAGTNKSDLENKYKSGDIDYAEYMAGLTDIDNSLNFDSMSGVIQGIIDNAYQGFEFNFDGRVGIGSDFEEDWDEDDDGIDDDAESEAQKGWEKLVNKYENQLALLSNERDLIQAEIDKAEVQGGKASTKYYDDLIDNSNAEKALLIQKKAALEEYLAANAGAIDQDTWTDYNNEINATAVAIKECEINTLEWAEAIREIDLHYFEQITDEVSRLGEELDFVNSLLEDEEVADENGNWSSAALTRMGLYTNQMELAAAEATRYQDEIDKLNEQYANGELSEEQYQEKLSELVSGQQNAIQSYEDAKDGIIEMNEARIDAIREGIEKEIEAYEDLIDAKKEELDAERDLHDFREDVKNQTKDIASLERRIAALSGSSAASDVAERRKLEAQLLEAKEGLNNTYYGHSRDAQSAALDEEAEAYTLSKERYIEQLEEQLKDTETLIENSIMDVMLNADLVYTELNELADLYGIDLSESLTLPWKNASAQAIKWKDELKASMTSGEYAALIGEGGAITGFANGVATKLKGSWITAQTAAKNYAGYLTGTELKNRFTNTLTGFGNQIQTIIDKWNGVRKAADDAYAAQTRKVTVGGTGSGSEGNDTGNDTPTTPSYTPAPKPAPKETVKLRGLMKTSREMILGPKSFVDKNTETINGTKYYRDSNTGYYYKINDLNSKRKYDGGRTTGWAIPKGTWFYTKHAKGTTGTTRDEWAITDEPQFGDELTMYATPEGTLSFMRAGSTVIPADLTRELIDLPKVVDGLINRPKFDSGINMIANAINKPEIIIDVENFLKVDRVDKDSLPQLEAMMDKKIDTFAKQLNYSIKKFAR